MNNFYPTKTTSYVPSPSTKSPLCIQGLCQADIDNMSEHLKLYFDVLSPCRAQITLYNGGSNPIRNGKWAIYICVLGIIQEQQLTNNPEGYVLPGGSHLKMTLISGCLYKLEPLSHFQSLASGDVIKVQFNTTLFRARCNLTPNWYIASDGLEPRTIANTAGEDLSFVFSSDKLTWNQFSAAHVNDLGHAPYMVIPTPKELVITDKTNKVTVGQEWRVYGDKGLENEVNFLASMRDICLFKVSFERRMQELLKLKTINYKFSCVYVNVSITEKKTLFHSVKLLSTLVAVASLREMSYAPKLFMCLLKLSAFVQKP